mgnify:CR=1 FL=1
MGKYTRFIVMILTSTLVMFGLMYLNTYAIDHVYFSETRTWMAIYMGAAMAIIMLLFMLGMYDDKRKNIGRRSSYICWLPVSCPIAGYGFRSGVAKGDDTSS